MRIKLNTDVQPMFPLLGLSFENPGPVEVDPAKLSTQQMLWIKNAERKGVLLIEGQAPTPVMPALPLAGGSNLPSSKKEAAKQLLKSTEINRGQKEGEALTALKAPVMAILSLINSSKDLQLLRIMRDLEGAGKKRKKLLDAFEARISELQSAVAVATGEPLSEKAILATDRNLRNLPEVEEEIEEEKTFTFNQE